MQANENQTKERVRIHGHDYEVVQNFRDGWNQHAFHDRYSPILERYDYIVGDWGYGQLRLKGFFENNRAKTGFHQKIASLDEYLQEYCNFGCPYFVLKKLPSGKKALHKTHMNREHQ